MNRRGFLNTLNAAIIGTVIALKIPESLVPLNKMIREPEITFSALNEAYDDCREKFGEPQEIVLHEKAYDDLVKRVGIRPSKQSDIDNADSGYLTFRKAYVRSHNGTGHGEDLIVIRPDGKPHSKRYHFV